MKKFIALLFGLFTIVASAQQIDAQTGNIVYTTLNPPPSGSPHTWNGFIVQNTNGGGLTGGNVPAYNTNTGTFIFGYNQGTVAYTNSINFALANAGSNIQVNGFKYSWQYFNQDLSRGTLSGNISLTSNTGQTLQNYYFSMPQTTQGWTTMSGIKNFATQYAASNLGNLNVSFTGKDDRWWAGYYGPQIRDIDVKLLYSVPVPKFSSWVNLTGENGTFTLGQAGIIRYGAEGTYIYKSYQAGTYECSNGAWGQDPLGGVYKSCSLGTNTTSTPPATPTTTTTTNNAATTTTENIIAAAAEPILLAPVTTTTSTTGTTSDPVSTTSTTTSSAPQSSPTATTTTASSNTTATATTAAAATATQVSTVASTPSSGGSRTVDGTSIGLSVVARNQQREQIIAMQASQNAINAADQTSQHTQQEALNVAQSSSTASNASSSNPMARINLTPQRSEQASFQSQASQSITSLASVALPGQQSNTNRQIDTNRFGLTTSSSLEATNIQSTAISNVLQEQAGQSQTQATFALLPPQQPQQLVTQTMPIVTSDSTQINSQFSITNQQSILAMNESSTSESQKFLTDRTNPINQIIEGKGIELPPVASVQQKTTVNTNVSDNEIAGGVNIGRMATIPPGYNQYLNLAIADASFYAPKEIYKNQKVIDNARVLRQLSSDRLHQQMVEQQYRR